MSTAMKYLCFAAFVAVVVGANWMVTEFGIVHWLGLTAAGGTWLAGFGFVARDFLQESWGKRAVVAAILVGAALSAILSPQIALASGVAFLVSEFADFAVYTPLRQRSRLAAALLSNTVGAIIDSLLFLSIAGFPLSGVFTQVLIKVGITTVFVLLVRALRPGRTVPA